MRARRYALVAAAAIAAMTWLGAAGAAQAVFPNFSGCTATNFETEGCIDIQNRSGNLNIKGFNVPLGESLEIRGTIRGNGTETPDFVPPAGTNGFFSRAVPVPGGLLGIEWIPGTSVLAITELAGPASAIRITAVPPTIRLPLKVRLVNTLLGMDCHIGTNRNPVNLNLISGTTSPPPPNRPISGRLGEFSFGERGIQIIGNVNVENSFAIPGATECGLGLGLINTLVNLKLKLPSAAGNNSAEIVNDVALGNP
jgi:hypothetical protein